MNNHYTCPRISCSGQRLLKVSKSTDYICFSCQQTYVIDDGMPKLKDPLVKNKLPKRTEESDMQQAVIRWTGVCRYKDILKHLHHSPNGGARSESEGARFKREGVRSGFPDLELNVARHGYHGLFVEMKATKGRLSDEQKDWRDFLISEGNYFCVCRSAEEAIETIKWYLNE